MAFVFKKITPRSRAILRKSERSQRILDALSNYIESGYKEPMKWLVRTWAEQANVFLYRDLYSIVTDEKFPQEVLDGWFRSYSEWVADKMTDTWKDAMMNGWKDNPIFQEAKMQGFVFDSSERRVADWIQNRGAELVTNCVQEQKDAIRYLVAEAQANGTPSAELGRYIRPTIGLTRPQAEANLKYYESVKAKLKEDHPRMKAESIERKARESAARYAAKQQRTRAETIARTEMAYAYNQGNDEAIRQATDKGLLPVMRKVWSTADDGHVCTACLDLEGAVIDMDSEFKVTIGKKAKKTLTVSVPPLHPRCKCAVMYEETGEHKNQVENPSMDDILSLSEKGEDLPYYLQDNPDVFRHFTPDQIKHSLEEVGMNVKPLSRGRLKGLAYEDGGGFKANFGGDGIIQYHPEKNSHHGASYYKIATGEKGLQRIILEGSGDNDSDGTGNQ